MGIGQENDKKAFERKDNEKRPLQIKRNLNLIEATGRKAPE